MHVAVGRRAWLPDVDLRVSGGRESSIGKDFDQAFTGGALRHLYDHDVERGSDVGGQLELSWSLGDLVYHPESIDVSREVRELIELRDAVLDEITQLYFERERVLRRAAALEAGEPEEAWLLRLRADELASGIDAWTGGWFGRQLAAARHPVTPPKQEEKP